MQSGIEITVPTWLLDFLARYLVLNKVLLRSGVESVNERACAETLVKNEREIEEEVEDEEEEEVAGRSKRRL